jgi:hypothetical protein
MMKSHRMLGLDENDRHDLITVLFCAFITAMVGCSRSERGTRLATDAGVAPGTVLIDILQGGQPERYWQYEVVPAKATVRSVKRETFLDYKHESLPTEYQHPAGATHCGDTSNEVASPNGELQASCSNSGYDQLSVTGRSGAVLYTWDPGRRLIRGFAWAPNSKSVAILNTSSRFGMGPLELLAAFSGHRVPHDTIFLDFLDVKAGKTTEYLIRSDVVSSFTRILKWEEQ